MDKCPIVPCVKVKAGQMLEVAVPISPQIEQGTITVKFQTISQILRQSFDVDLEILVGHSRSNLT